MFSTDQNISSLKDLILEIKSCASMRYELAKLDLVSRITLLFAALFLGLVLMFLLGTALLFLSYSAAQGLALWMDSEGYAFLTISGFYVLLAVIAYCLRKRLFIRPIAKFISKIFLDPIERKEDTK